MNTSTKFQIYRKPEVLQTLAISKSTLHEWINDGLLPPPVNLGRRAVGWYKHEIEHLLIAMGAGLNRDEIRLVVGQITQARLAAWNKLRQ